MKSFNIIIIGLIILSCNSNPGKQNNEQKAQDSTDFSIINPDKSKLVLGRLSEINFGESIKITGMIDVPPKNKAMVSTFIGGYIIQTPLIVGDKVSKGQFLVSLENPKYVELQQDYLELSEQLTYLESEYNRQKILFDENITSKKNFLKSQSIYKSSLAHYNGLKTKLQMLNIEPKAVEAGKITSKINIYAPIAGYVTKVNIRNGVYVSEQDIIMEIVDTDHIHLELSVFEKDIMKVKKGQQIQFQIPEASSEIFFAEVHLVGTTIDETTRRVRVHGHVDNGSNLFMVGMYVTAEILLSENLTPALPKSAILNNENGNFVFVQDELENTQNDYKKSKVILGQQNENFIEILNPEVFKDKTIIIDGIEELE